MAIRQPPQQPRPSQMPSTGAGVAAGGAAAGLVPATAGGAAAAAIAAKGVEIPSSVARASAEAVILAALIGFLARKREADVEFLRAEVRSRAQVANDADIQALVNEERQRDEAFALKQAERVGQETARILALPDAADREREMQALMDREQRYVEQRAEAMAARAIGQAERLELRVASPQGAMWLLGIAKDHTTGCLAMAGKFWPWEVLDRVHPPRHPGCTAYLISLDEAVRRGLMERRDVPNVHDALRRAAGVVMEEDAETAHKLAALADSSEAMNGDLRRALIEAGLTTPELFDHVTEAFRPTEPRDWHGRWRKLGEIADAMARLSVAWNQRAGRDISNAPPHEQIKANWSKQLRGRLSKDEEAHRLLAAAEAENGGNKLWQRIIAAHEPDHVALVTPAPEGQVRALLDSSAAAHRLAGTTVITEDAVKTLAAEPPRDAKYRPAASSAYGLAAVLRHEYGHSIDESLPKDLRRKIIDAIPDPGEDLTYYAGYYKSKGNDGEVIPELLAIITEPGFDPRAWPATVQSARNLLLNAMGLAGGRS